LKPCWKANSGRRLDLAPQVKANGSETVAHESRVTQAIGRVKRGGPPELAGLKKRLEQVYESYSGEVEA
jgi:hypothetical protein